MSGRGQDGRRLERGERGKARAHTEEADSTSSTPGIGSHELEARGSAVVSGAEQGGVRLTGGRTWPSEAADVEQAREEPEKVWERPWKPTWDLSGLGRTSRP